MADRTDRNASPEDSLAEAYMTDSSRPVCGYPEPCACYAEEYAHGKEKAHFEVRTVLDSNHAASCGCEPCETVREILRRNLATDDRLLRQFEVQTMNGHDN